MNEHPEPKTDESAAADRSPEQHHGDLRKGAYLRRRAAYQLQANAPSTPQAGTLTTAGGSAKSADELP